MIKEPGHSTDDIKRKCYTTYFLLGIGHIFSLISLILCYKYKRRSIGTPYYSHFKWQIKTFWIGLPIFGMVIGLTYALFYFRDYASNFITITMLVFLWIFQVFWWYYRIAFGLIDLGEGKPVTFSEQDKIIRAVSETF